MFYQTLFKKASSAEDQWLNKFITYSQATDHLNKDSNLHTKSQASLQTRYQEKQ